MYAYILATNLSFILFEIRNIPDLINVKTHRAIFTEQFFWIALFST